MTTKRNAKRRGASERKKRVELLQEAALLAQLGSEWEVAHVAAFCTVSESFIYRSDCPRIEKHGQRDVKGKPMVRFSTWDGKARDKAVTTIAGYALCERHAWNLKLIEMENQRPARQSA